MSVERGAIVSMSEVKAIGFKTVTAKGYLGVHELTEDVLAAMEEYVEVAPVHTLSYLEAIKKFKEILPGALMVGVFETDFHRTIPKEARLYGIPYEWYEEYGIERLGFHGASHGYIASQVAQMAGSQVQTDFLPISAAVHPSARSRTANRSRQASVFLCRAVYRTPTAWATSTQYALVYLMKKGLSLDVILNGLYKKGGLYGISGISNDLRDIQDAAKSGNARAKLTIVCIRA